MSGRSGANLAAAKRPQDGVRIRAARADDLPLLVTVLEMAARGHLQRGAWDLLLPDEQERARALGWLADVAPRSWCHRSLFLVADLDGAPSAALCAFDPDDLGGTSLAAPLRETFTRLGWSPARSSAALQAMAPYAACFPEMAGGTWIVENVGTLPQARRRGLLRRLLEHALELGRRRGCGSAQISCLVGNDAARAAYEGAGFERREEICLPSFAALMGSPGFLRMSRPL